MPPKEATAQTPTRKTPARGAKNGATEPGTYTRASRPTSNLAKSPMQVSDDDSTTQRVPTKPVIKPAGPIAAAMAKGKKVTDQETPVADPASDTTANDQQNKGKGNPKAKGKKSDTSEVSDDEPSRVKQRNRSKPARQIMLKEDRYRFAKIKNTKDKFDRKADALAAAKTNDNDDDDDDDDGGDNEALENRTKDKKSKKAPPKPKATAKKAAPADAVAQSDDEATDGAAGNDAPANDTGNNPPKKAAPKKAAASKKANAASKPRNHRERTYDYKLASDGSDFDGVIKNSYSRLWGSVNRHAKWCPFVRINKKHHNSYRKIKKMEAQLARLAHLMADSGDDDDDKPVPKAKKAKPVPKKGSPKKRGKSKPENSQADEDQDSENAQSIIEIQDEAVDDVPIPADSGSEFSSDDDRTGSGSEDSEGDISDEDESEGVLDTKKATTKATSAKKDSSSKKTRTEASEADKAHNIGTSDSSDQDLSSLSAGKLAELQGAFNKEMASAAKGGAGRKRKVADAETTTQEPAKKTKKQRKSKDDSVLALEEVL